MTAVRVVEEDLEDLKQLVPDLRFDDEERREALLENSTKDFNAVPGSGKTSLLAAKLLLLAKKWPHSRKGICILSHTNIAREELTRRLAASAEGSRLLTYPHFIGTIHGFINQFLAMAALRNLGIKVDVIDDEIFARRAWSIANSYRFSKLRYWVRNQCNGETLVSELFYKGAKLNVLSDGGKLPGAHTGSYKQLVELKNMLADEGLFRHRDMFAFAELALAEQPHLLDVIYRRFPMVFIDEMQDTSWEQEDILNRLFDDRSIVQRFGDIDQQIISGDPDAGKRTFPRKGHGTISTSKRFGGRIAEAVESVRGSQLPVIGEANDVYSPTLILYRTADISQVLFRFGDLVVDRFPDPEMAEGAVKAMCARRSGQGNVDPGRHMVDYWPAFDQANKTSAKESLRNLISTQHDLHDQPTLMKRASDVQRAILLILRAAKAPVSEGLRDGRSLLRAVREKGGNIIQLQRLIHELTLHSIPLVSVDDWTSFAAKVYQDLFDLLPNGLTVEEFTALDLFSQFEEKEQVKNGDLPTFCKVISSGRELRYSLGTVASMKGETHLASLVLESYGGLSKRFDLQMALPFIAGLRKDFSKLKTTQQAQMRNLYVAMSRPRELLCLAANQSRVEDSTIDALVGKGWVIDRLS
ncbi:MAG: ATP-dependent helicase [Gammaproteobacteria bacterium]|nr:ATP-dependent helicase [Gammaproteobacteria bacterium]